MKWFGDAIKAAAVSLTLATPAAAGSTDQGNVSPGQFPTLTAEWWQWIFSMPVSVNPNLDGLAKHACSVSGVHMASGGHFPRHLPVTARCRRIRPPFSLY